MENVEAHKFADYGNGTSYCIREGTHRIGYVYVRNNSWTCCDRDNSESVPAEIAWFRAVKDFQNKRLTASPSN